MELSDNLRIYHDRIGWRDSKTIQLSDTSTVIDHRKAQDRPKRKIGQSARSAKAQDLSTTVSPTKHPTKHPNKWQRRCRWSSQAATILKLRHHVSCPFLAEPLQHLHSTTQSLLYAGIVFLHFSCCNDGPRVRSIALFLLRFVWMCLVCAFGLVDVRSFCLISVDATAGRVE
eukprot:SAG31_NODE_739_length_12444_cov_14.976831_9_plen_172_part_00